MVCYLLRPRYGSWDESLNFDEIYQANVVSNFGINDSDTKIQLFISAHRQKSEINAELVEGAEGVANGNFLGWLLFHISWNKIFLLSELS